MAWTPDSKGDGPMKRAWPTVRLVFVTIILLLYTNFASLIEQVSKTNQDDASCNLSSASCQARWRWDTGSGICAIYRHQSYTKIRAVFLFSFRFLFPVFCSWLFRSWLATTCILWMGLRVTFGHFHEPKSLTVLESPARLIWRQRSSRICALYKILSTTCLEFILVLIGTSCHKR